LQIEIGRGSPGFINCSETLSTPGRDEGNAVSTEDMDSDETIPVGEQIDTNEDSNSGVNNDMNAEESDINVNIGEDDFYRTNGNGKIQKCGICNKTVTNLA